MQSGITASAELTEAFNTLVSDSSKFALLATIAKEQLVPGELIPASSDDFLENLSFLAPHIQPKEALYLLLRRSSTPTGFVAVTYVPNAAPVRQKMLFASTRLTLVRELGTERFGEQLFVTEAEELTKEGWNKHEQHAALPPPLTEEETVLGEVKRKEQEEGTGTGARKNHIGGSGSLKMTVTDEALEALKALSSDSSENLVQLRINIQTEITELDAATETDLDSLPAAISPDEPRFSFFRHSNGAVFFVYTCPSGSKVKERMIYASSRLGVVRFAEAEAGLKVVKRLEESEPAELDLGDFEVKEQPKLEVKARFDRPKRPGRN